MDFWFTKTHEDGLSTKRIVERFWNLVTQIILQDILDEDKTRLEICSRYYYWVGLVNDVDEMVITCDACQKHSKINKKSSQLHPIKVKEEVWSRIGIDLIGPLNETPRGNKLYNYMHRLFQQMA